MPCQRFPVVLRACRSGGRGGLSASGLWSRAAGPLPGHGRPGAAVQPGGAIFRGRASGAAVRRHGRGVWYRARSGAGCRQLRIYGCLPPADRFAGAGRCGRPCRPVAPRFRHDPPGRGLTGGPTRRAFCRRLCRERAEEPGKGGRGCSAISLFPALRRRRLLPIRHASAARLCRRSQPDRSRCRLSPRGQAVRFRRVPGRFPYPSAEVRQARLRFPWPWPVVGPPWRPVRHPKAGSRGRPRVKNDLQTARRPFASVMRGAAWRFRAQGRQGPRPGADAMESYSTPPPIRVCAGHIIPGNGFR